jgi:hypothetical protein
MPQEAPAPESSRQSAKSFEHRCTAKNQSAINCSLIITRSFVTGQLGSTIWRATAVSAMMNTRILTMALMARIANTSTAVEGSGTAATPAGAIAPGSAGALN